MNSKTTYLVKLVLCVLLCQAAGVIGSFFTTPSIPTWYAGLNKPFFSPPSYVFAPVWITLYFMMGLSLSFVWLRVDKDKNAKKAIAIFLPQLILNIIWSIAFFGLKSPAAGFATIAILWISIAWTIRAFSKVSVTSAVLLMPYIIWVTFAAMLNLAIWLLN
ncbi:MAG: tryptophan-rich sensory protein [Candidatus Altiarchaeota archaeon]|nr:tryptophan-rich sensory protein [Candidatus Altiarchaeota archaeon]